MLSNPRVSVVIPMYNQQEGFLRDCLDSVLAQTYSNLEIVVSDNHSTNNASAVLKEYEALDSRIRIVKPEKFLSISDNFLFVFSQSTCEYSCYVSSDDILDRSCVEILARGMIGNSSAVFAHGKAFYFQKNGGVETRWTYFNNKTGAYGLDEEETARLLRFQYVCFAGCMIKNCVWPRVNKILKDEKIKLSYSIDVLLVTILFKMGHVYYFNQPLASVRIENESRNARLPLLIRDAAMIWDYWEGFPKRETNIELNRALFDEIKNEQYLEYNRMLFYEYTNKFYDYKSFRLGVQNLELYRLPKPRIFNIFTKIMLLWPFFGTSVYKILKKS